MTVRQPPSDGNLPNHLKRQTQVSSSDDGVPLLTQRAALVLITALIIGAAAGILAYLAGARPAEAVLTGGGAFGAALPLLNKLIGR